MPKKPRKATEGNSGSNENQFADDKGGCIQMPGQVVRDAQQEKQLLRYKLRFLNRAKTLRQAWFTFGWETTGLRGLKPAVKRILSKEGEAFCSDWGLSETGLSGICDIVEKWFAHTLREREKVYPDMLRDAWSARQACCAFLWALDELKANGRLFQELGGISADPGCGGHPPSTSRPMNIRDDVGYYGLESGKKSADKVRMIPAPAASRSISFKEDNASLVQSLEELSEKGADENRAPVDQIMVIINEGMGSHEEELGISDAENEDVFPAQLAAHLITLSDEIVGLIWAIDEWGSKCRLTSEQNGPPGIAFDDVENFPDNLKRPSHRPYKKQPVTLLVEKLVDYLVGILEAPVEYIDVSLLIKEAFDTGQIVYTEANVNAAVSKLLKSRQK